MAEGDGASARSAGPAAPPAGRWLALSLAAFALIAAALFVSATVADREATMAQGRTTAENTAALLAEHADRTLRVAEITARRLEALVLRDGMTPGEALHEALRRLAADAPEVGSVVLLRPDGRVAAASVMRDPPPIDLSDRAFVAAIQAGATETLSPLVRARPFNTWSFTFNRAIRRDGQLLGIAHIALHAEDFARITERLSLGRAAEFRLLRRDGETMMSWPLPAALPLPPAPRREGADGIAEEAGRDGVVRLVAWRAAPSMPVVAEAALSLDEVLAPFQRRLLRNLGLFALSVALAGWLAQAALRAGRREAAARRAVEERGAALAEALAERLSLLASLQEGEARLRLAQEAGGLGLWDLDLAQRRLVLIGEVFAIWGLPQRAARGMRSLPLRAIRRSIHPDDRAVVTAAFRAALRERAPFAAEFRLAKDGPARWIGVRAEPRLGAKGEPSRLLGIALEVTAQHQAQAALEESRAMLARRVAERTSALAEANARLREGEARFRGLFNATFQFIGLLSPDGTVLEANAAMLRLGGMRESEVVGTAYWDAPWWPADRATQALLREAIAEGAAGRFVRRETAMRDADGAVITVDFSVTPVRDEDGLVSLLVAEARDVSALKSAQALLHEAQKMDTLGQLTGGVAHDFNNLLMAVLANLAIARKRVDENERKRVDEESRKRVDENARRRADGPPDGGAADDAPAQAEPRRAAAGADAPGRTRDLARYIDAAIQAAERGATLTQRLLAFARRQDLKPAAVDLRGLLLGLEALLRRSAGPLVSLEIEAPEGLPPAHVDPHALELALVNLAVNARDAMPEGGAFAVRLALVEGAAPGRLAPGRWLTIAVSDTGAGMDEATLARAVEPFFTTKGPGRGTGLGLSMVDGLAAQSGGALVLDSAPGCGTTATLWLPVSAMLPSVPAARPPGEVATGRGAVLVVDDEDLVLESTAAMLEELGYEPLPAESGEAALDLLAARRDVVAVLTDHAMPGMTGMALAARIRAGWPGLPVIVTTGHAGAWADTADAPPRLMKPYDLGQLADALQGAVRRAAAE